MFLFKDLLLQIGYKILIYGSVHPQEESKYELGVYSQNMDPKVHLLGTKVKMRKKLAIISSWTIQSMFSVQNIFSAKRLIMFCEKFMHWSLLLYFLKEKLFQVLKRQQDFKYYLLKQLFINIYIMFKRSDSFQTTWTASWEIHMEVRKQQLELDMEQQTGFKSEKSMSRLYIVTLLI